MDNPPRSASTTIPPKKPCEHLVVCLDQLAIRAKEGPLTFSEAFSRLEGESFGFICMILALPFIQPFPLGPLSMSVGAAFIALGWQVLQGRDAPFLPPGLNRFSLSANNWCRLATLARWIVSQCARFCSRSRMQRLASGRPGRRLAGVLTLLAGSLKLVPTMAIPFTSSLPALAVLLAWIALAEEDGLLMLLAMLCLLGGILYLALIGFFAWKAGTGMVQVL